MDRVLFIGSKDLGYKILCSMYELSPETLDACITFDDCNDVRSSLKEIQSYCADNEIPCYVLDGKCDISEIVLERKPTICFVAGWYRLIPQDIINSVPRGFIGIHNSLLPAYRGQSPLVWAMMNGEKRVGLSIFSFSEGMDAGDIWGQDSIAINEDMYICDILKELTSKAVKLFRSKYLNICSGGGSFTSVWSNQLLRKTG